MKKPTKNEIRIHIDALLDEIDAAKLGRAAAKKANLDISEYNKWLAQCRAKIRELEGK